MADVTIIRAGRWGLSRPVFIDGGWTTYAMQQRLGSGGVDNYWPPQQVDGAPAVDAVLVRLKGTVTAPADGNTVLFPRNLDDLADVTLGELTAAQRDRIRTTLEAWLTGYTFIDWDGTEVTIPPFSERIATYTLDTTLKQIARHIFKHLWHSLDRPKPRVIESHNTEYLDDFSTDPFAGRWTQEVGAWTWDSGNSEVDAPMATTRSAMRYSANGPGSIEHEAQVTGKQGGGGGADGVGFGACRFDDTGVDDWYLAMVLLSDAVTLYRINAGARTTLTTFTGGFVNAGNEFITGRMAVSGGIGATAVVDLWYENHGASKPSDPGWIGVDGSPDLTYSDTSAGRLDDAAHADCGVAVHGQGSDWDTQFSYFKLRAISDRTSDEITGTGVLAAQSADITGSGLSASAGIGGLSAQAAAVDGAGVSASSGSGTLAAQASDLTGAGLSLSTGSGALSAQAADVNGGGLSLSIGTGVLSAQAAAIDGSGTVEVEEITGTGALAAQASTLAGTGQSSSTGSGSLAAQEAVLEAMAISASAGSGALSAQAAAIDGAGLSLSTGSGVLAAQPSTVSGDGNLEVEEITGTGVLAAQAATLEGIGDVEVEIITGEGELVAQSASVVGVGSWVSVRRLAAGRTATRGGPIQVRQGTRVPKRG